MRPNYGYSPTAGWRIRYYSSLLRIYGLDSPEAESYHALYRGIDPEFEAAAQVVYRLHKHYQDHPPKG